MAKNDTVTNETEIKKRAPWNLDHRINWIEWRVRELTIKKGQYVDDRGQWLLEEKAAGGRKLTPGDQIADYAVWLLKVRDDLSWHQIAYRFFPYATEEHIEAYESKVRRMFDRVERGHPGSSLFKPTPLSKEDRVLVEAIMLGVIPVYLEGKNQSGQ
jgi:hypothetical protein